MHPFTEYLNPYLGELLHNVALDKTFVRGEGCYLYDDHGNGYLDCIAAYGALPFGHNPASIWEAVADFRHSGEPNFVQPSFLDAAGELARRLVELAPPGLRYVTFTNSGAEAVEAALKLCRSATGRQGILAAENSFHGKTLGRSPLPGTRFTRRLSALRRKDLTLLNTAFSTHLKINLLKHPRPMLLSLSSRSRVKAELSSAARLPCRGQKDLRALRGSPGGG